MSAYLCDNEHISYLVQSAMWVGRKTGGGFYWYEDGESHRVDDRNELEVGQMLREENLKSLEAYALPESRWLWEGHEDYEEVTPFTWETCSNIIQIIKAVHCYQYQSCEHRGWLGSGAKNFTDTLLHLAVGLLPGYDEAEWGAPEPSVFRPARKMTRAAA